MKSHQISTIEQGVCCSLCTVGPWVSACSLLIGRKLSAVAHSSSVPFYCWRTKHWGNKMRKPIQECNFFFFFFNFQVLHWKHFLSQGQNYSRAVLSECQVLCTPGKVQHPSEILVIYLSFIAPLPPTQSCKLTRTCAWFLDLIEGLETRYAYLPPTLKCWCFKQIDKSDGFLVLFFAAMLAAH